MPGIERLAGNLHSIPPGKPGLTVEGRDAFRPITIFMLRGDGIGKAALESDQLRPVDVWRTDNPLAVHAPGMVDHRGPSDQHLFRIATAQGTSAAKGLAIYHSYGPAGRTAAHGGNPCRRSRSDNEQIKLLCHV